VIRDELRIPDLRGKWFLGVDNTDSTNVAYTIRARGGQQRPAPQRPAHRRDELVPSRRRCAGFYLQWNSVEGERYDILVHTQTVARHLDSDRKRRGHHTVRHFCRAAAPVRTRRSDQLVAGGGHT